MGLRIMNKSALIIFSMISALLLKSPFGYAAAEMTVTLSTGDDITIKRYPASGNYLMLWLAPEYGFRDTHRTMAQKISEQGIEVWQCNLLESLFLTQTTSSIRQLDNNYVADLIENAHQNTGKKIVMTGDSYAALNVLGGINQWQQRDPDNTYLTGAILFTPYTFASIPPLGGTPDYMPVVSATNVPVMIYQARNSPIYSQFGTLLSKLRINNNTVYSRIMPEMMSLYYENPPTRAMVEQAETIPVNVKQMIRLLDTHTPPRQAIPLPVSISVKSGIDIQLKKMDHRPMPTLSLNDINGNRVTKTDYRGKVTLINFWATWCPPCVEEIPSLNRLQQKMKGQPFEIISINYAEDTSEIRRFMEKVAIEFPVLLDMNGDFARDLNVISYPSTFVIDSSGKISYGVNAAIEWDSPEQIKKLKSLY